MDQKVICRDCNLPFTFSAGEAKFFAARDFEPPKRCRDCRAHRKEDKQMGVRVASRVME